MTVKTRTRATRELNWVLQVMECNPKEMHKCVKTIEPGVVEAGLAKSSLFGLVQA